MKMIQKLMGLALIAMGAVVVAMAMTSPCKCPDCTDVTAAIMLIPMGIWLLTSRKILIHL